MELYPPVGPYLFQTEVFGIPIAVRWYAIFIMSGALLGAWLASRRAIDRGVDPDHVWNQLLLGLIMGIADARIYYVIFEWSRFADDPLSALNLTTGGLAIHGALIGALLAALIYARYAGLRLLAWLDMCVPGFLLAQAIGRWGNFINQEAYGAPTDLGFGVRIDPAQRIPPYDNLQLYPPDTLFHATFLYESLWSLAGVGLLLWLDRRFGTQLPAEQRRLNHGDLLFSYAIYYSLGRLWIEGLRTDSLCLQDAAGMCLVRVAQLVSLVLIGAGTLALVLRQRSGEPPSAAPPAAERGRP
jgi:phosphatidylglycerol---prolipoprotein diacylglyceryl transferase